MLNDSHSYKTREIYGERKTIAWCPCTPPSTVETFGEKISAEACSGKEIAGSLKKMMMAKIALSVNELFKNVSFQIFFFLLLLSLFSFNKRNSKDTEMKLCTKIGIYDPVCKNVLICL